MKPRWLERFQARWSASRPIPEAFRRVYFHSMEERAVGITCKRSTTSGGTKVSHLSADPLTAITQSPLSFSI